jgi:hypothetical protein
MATTKQRAAAKENVKKAQKAWQSMSSSAHSRAQPEGRKRTRPGAGEGEFFHIEVRPHVGGDRFIAAPRPDVPEQEKPTAAQERAWHENIEKAQAARPDH